ncbi:unnamed protein product [Pseudo-nitzschia multistriata]|uniref:Uncharacterized protein n=1 Tax=Pseudo-nitzschia multistriata TaxID=183589 RepID=A0A448ZDA2_9STRA|nr:unnamed protein product [Pseudo-nitzschia multistriata]
MVTTSDLLFRFVAAAITFGVVNVNGVDANWLPWSSSSEAQVGSVSLNQFQSFWIEATDIISDLDSYDKLWIKPHSCVWSECNVDDTDDGYTGDNRDGDEQWYQYRTQGFCANAAYSLYGRKKEDGRFPSFSGCSRRHFINSFFTYGGADNLLKSIGESPVVYNYNGEDNGSNDNANNEDGNGSSANEICVEIEYGSGYDDNVNEDQSGSGSGSNDNNEFSGTLGCGPDGEYVIAAFESSSCDGNYFAGIVNNFDEYNEQHSAIGCHNIYQYGNEASVEDVTMLLSNSWSCDRRLYPNGCPDPYGKKQSYDFAIRTVAHGGNAERAYRNMMLKLPLHIVSWVLLALTVTVFILTYLVKNESRAIESKGGRNFVGYLRCIGEDIVTGWGCFCTLIVNWCRSSCEDGQSSTEGSAAKDDDDNVSTDDSDNSYVKVEEKQPKKKNRVGVALKRSVSAFVKLKGKTRGSADKEKSKELQKEKDFSRSPTWH